MSIAINKFEVGTEEREKLQIVAVLLTNRSPNGYLYYVDETYFDFGQDWMWTTILCTGDGDTYQALNPNEQEEIIFAERYDELVRIAEEVLNDKFCQDSK